MNKPNISVRQGFAQRHRRSVLAAAVLIILSVVLACLVMTCGNTYYSLAEVWKILTSEGTKGAAFTIKTLRWNRIRGVRKHISNLASESTGKSGYYWCYKWSQCSSSVLYSDAQMERRYRIARCCVGRTFRRSVDLPAGA